MVNVVVSRYNEDLSWLSIVRHKKIVYNKGYVLGSDSIPLENIGREAHTFLYHIVNNYFRLSDWTIFLQGHPFDHCSNIIDLVNSFPEDDSRLCQLSSGCYSLSDKNLEEHQNDVEHLRVYSEKLYQQMFGSLKSYFVYSPGAQYIVHKNNITNRPINFYSDILYNYDWKHDLPWSIERLWPDIFDTKIHS